MAEAEAVFGNLDCSNPSSHTIVCGGGGSPWWTSMQGKGQDGNHNLQSLFKQQNQKGKLETYRANH